MSIFPTSFPTSKGRNRLARSRKWDWQSQRKRAVSLEITSPCENLRLHARGVKKCKNSPSRTRTYDPAVNSRLLYQLSYQGKRRDYSGIRSFHKGDLSDHKVSFFESETFQGESGIHFPPFHPFVRSVKFFPAARRCEKVFISVLKGSILARHSRVTGSYAARAKRGFFSILWHTFMKIGIYGGSFDPIHFGHLLLAETCLRECELDRIIFVPTGVAPHKPDKSFAGAEDRIEMANLAIFGCEEFSTSRYEIDSRAERNYTVDTLIHFKESLLDPQLYLILGADMFNDLPYWFRADEICRLAIPIVAARPNTSAPYFEALSPIVTPARLELFREHLVSMPQIELSSTRIRTRIAEGKTIRFQTPRVVESYIMAHRLYRDV